MENFLKSQNLCGGKGELFNLEEHTQKKRWDSHSQLRRNLYLSPTMI